MFSFCSWQCTLVTLLFFNYTNLKFLQEGAKSNIKSPSRIFNIIYTILTHVCVNIGLSKIEPLCFSSFAIIISYSFRRSQNPSNGEHSKWGQAVYTKNVVCTFVVLKKENICYSIYELYLESLVHILTKEQCLDLKVLSINNRDMNDTMKCIEKYQSILQQKQKHF